MTAFSWANINSLADHWTWYMTSSLLDATVGMVLVGCLFLAVWRHVPARWCYLLFLLIPMKLVLPIPLPLLPSWTTVIDAKTSVIHQAPRSADDPLHDSARLARAFAAESAPGQAPSGNRSGSRGPTTVAAQDGTHALPSTATLLMLLWGSIVLAMGCRFAWNQFCLMRLLACASPVSLSMCAVNLNLIKSRLGIRREIQVVATDQINVPAVVGLLAPRILLPKPLLAFLDAHQLDCVLAHELAHVRWYDVHVALLERLVRIVHFMNPALWLAAHLAQLQRENACDDAAIILAKMDRRTYAATLLRVVEFSHGEPPAAAPAVALFERTNSHRRRLYRIMATQTTAKRANLGRVLLLLGSTILILPNLRPGPPKSPQNEAAAAARTTVPTPSSAESNRTRSTKHDKKPTKEFPRVVKQGALVEKAHDIKRLLNRGTDPESLIDLVKSSVLPSSWDILGGGGTITIDSKIAQMRVKNFASVQQAIARVVASFETILNEKMKRNPDAPLPAIRSVDLFFQSGQLVRIYVIPSLLFPDPLRRDSESTEADYDTLIELTTTVIAPSTWEENGGPGNIVPWEIGTAVVVAQPPANQDQIAKLYSRLDSLPEVLSRPPPPTIEPVDIAEQAVALGSQATEAPKIELETRLYPVHDLLPRETKPVFSVSPRAVGLDQLSAWFVKQAAPQAQQPVAVIVFPAKEAIILTASVTTHRQVTQALSKLRKRSQEAKTPGQRSALEAELFPATFRVTHIGRFLTGNRPIDQRVYLHGMCNADHQLARLSHHAESVVELQLIDADVTDKGLEKIAKFAALTNLTIWSTRLTDAGVAHLKAVSRLRRLSLHGKQITDAAVAAIAAIPSLHNIDLANTSVSDTGLKQLVGIKNRSWLLLDVSHTKVTPAAVESARQAQPRFDIRYSE